MINIHVDNLQSDGRWGATWQSKYWKGAGEGSCLVMNVEWIVCYFVLYIYLYRVININAISIIKNTFIYIINNAICNSK